MSGEKHGRGVEQAREMIATFKSLGVGAFDLTITDIDGQQRGFRAAQSCPLLRRRSTEWIAWAAECRRNLIVRPHGARVTLIQLDDLHAATLERVRTAGFLILCTSPGNHQAWVAVRDCVADFARQLRRGSGADACASGATRMAGSVNFKRQYAPQFPVVTLLEASPQRTVSRAELQELGLVAQPDPRFTLPSWRRRVSSSHHVKAWPSYERCVRNAPLAHGVDRPDISRADFTFCLLAIDWGWGIEETVECLMLRSPKARENGEAYARLTAHRAAAAVARRFPGQLTSDGW